MCVGGAARRPVLASASSRDSTSSRSAGLAWASNALRSLHRQLQRFVIQALDLFPCGCGIHDDSRFISRINQLRASRQSRFTVPTETPIASAVSSMLRPPK